MIRSFIAVPLDGAIRRSLARTMISLQGVQAGVKWVDPQAAHVTLVFLGDIEDNRVLTVAERLKAAVEEFEPFDVAVAGIGTFPPRGLPAVVWAGLEENAPLMSRLHDRIVREMEELGFRPEGRRFVPHVTLGRVKGTKGVDRLLAVIEREAATSFGTMTVDRVQLMMSKLKPEGPEYAVMSTAILTDRA